MNIYFFKLIIANIIVSYNVSSSEIIDSSSIISTNSTDAVVIINNNIEYSKQVEYIKDVALYYFSKLRWYRKFEFQACPEFETITVTDEDFCPLGFLPPLRPLFHLNRCDVNPQLADCVTYFGSSTFTKISATTPSIISSSSLPTPTCALVPNICEDPLFCDWESNKNLTACMNPNLNCTLTPTSPECQPMSKCSLPDYATLPDCQLNENCKTNPELCLDICDIDPTIMKNECNYKKCQFFPNTPNCDKLINCIPITACSGKDFLLKSECIINPIIDPICKKFNNCQIYPPSFLCGEYFFLGETFINYFSESIIDNLITSDTIYNLIKCYSSLVVVNIVEKECFMNGILQGFDTFASSTFNSSPLIV